MTLEEPSRTIDLVPYGEPDGQSPFPRSGTSRVLVAKALSLCLLMIVACTSEASPDAPTEAPPDSPPETLLDAPNDEADALSDAPTGPGGGDTGAVFVAGCEGLPSPCADNPSPDCGRCQYRILHGSACSAASPCDDLVLYWSNYGCDAMPLAAFASSLLAATPDLVFACVQPMFPGELLPSSMGAPERDDLVVGAVYERVRPGGDLGMWSGANMLTGGCSAGASRTPVVAARTSADERWLGSATNAACLSDGVVSIADQDVFVGEGVALGSRSCSGRHSRIASAYTRTEPAAGHACADSPGGQCACDPAHATRSYPGTCGDGDCLRHDSIIAPDGSGGHRLAEGVEPSDFAIPHWRMMIEGGAHAAGSERCERDVVGNAPFAALCTELEASPDHTCELVDRPMANHCAAYNSQFADVCLSWFRSL